MGFYLYCRLYGLGYYYQHLYHRQLRVYCCRVIGERFDLDRADRILAAIDRGGESAPLALLWIRWLFSEDKLGAQTPAYFIYTASGFKPKTAHNGGISILLSFGYPGLVLILLSLFTNLILAVRQLSRSPLSQSGIPIIYLVFIILNNLTESSLGEMGGAWLAYVLLTVRLCIDSSKSPSSNSRIYGRD